LDVETIFASSTGYIIELSPCAGISSARREELLTELLGHQHMHGTRLPTINSNTQITIGTDHIDGDHEEQKNKERNSNTVTVAVSIHNSSTPTESSFSTDTDTSQVTFTDISDKNCHVIFTENRTSTSEPPPLQTKPYFPPLRELAPLKQYKVKTTSTWRPPLEYLAGEFHPPNYTKENKTTSLTITSIQPSHQSQTPTQVSQISNFSIPPNTNFEGNRSTNTSPPVTTPLGARQRHTGAAQNLSHKYNLRNRTSDYKGNPIHPLAIEFTTSETTNKPTPTGITSGLIAPNPTPVQTVSPYEIYEIQQSNSLLQRINLDELIPSHTFEIACAQAIREASRGSITSPGSLDQIREIKEELQKENSEIFLDTGLGTESFQSTQSAFSQLPEEPPKLTPVGSIRSSYQTAVGTHEPHQISITDTQPPPILRVARRVQLDPIAFNLLRPSDPHREKLITNINAEAAASERNASFKPIHDKHVRFQDPATSEIRTYPTASDTSSNWGLSDFSQNLNNQREREPVDSETQRQEHRRIQQRSVELNIEKERLERHVEETVDEFMGEQIRNFQRHQDVTNLAYDRWITELIQLRGDLGRKAKQIKETGVNTEPTRPEQILTPTRPVVPVKVATGCWEQGVFGYWIQEHGTGRQLFIKQSTINLLVQEDNRQRATAQGRQGYDTIDGNTIGYDIADCSKTVERCSTIEEKRFRIEFGLYKRPNNLNFDGYVGIGPTIEKQAKLTEYSSSDTSSDFDENWGKPTQRTQSSLDESGFLKDPNVIVIDPAGDPLTSPKAHLFAPGIGHKTEYRRKIFTQEEIDAQLRPTVVTTSTPNKDASPPDFPTPNPTYIVEEPITTDSNSSPENNEAILVEIISNEPRSRDPITGLELDEDNISIYNGPTSPSIASWVSLTSSEESNTSTTEHVYDEITIDSLESPNFIYPATLVEKAIHTAPEKEQDYSPGISPFKTLHLGPYAQVLNQSLTHSGLYKYNEGATRDEKLETSLPNPKDLIGYLESSDPLFCCQDDLDFCISDKLGII
jgi:hypothetical protein